MNVETLIALLQNENPLAEVRLANQPHYPLQHAVRGVYSAISAGAADCRECGGDGCDECEDAETIGTGDPEKPGAVWIVEGGRTNDDHPYGPRNAWDACATCV